MAANFSSTVLAGNLTRDPELKALGETSVCNVSIAVNRTFKGKDGNKAEETSFFDIECWGRTAELAAQYLTKGSSALFQGRLKQERFEDKDGNKRSKIKLVADVMQFLDSKAAASTSGAAVPAAASAPAPTIDGADEPPF